MWGWSVWHDCNTDLLIYLDESLTKKVKFIATFFEIPFLVVSYFWQLQSNSFRRPEKTYWRISDSIDKPFEKQSTTMDDIQLKANLEQSQLNFLGYLIIF